MSWLAPLRGRIGLVEDLLVICRTQATVRAVLRALAETGPAGFAGLRVTTVAGALAEVEDMSVETVGETSRDAPLPVDHAWSASLAARPRLRAELRSVIARLHAATAAGVSLDGLSPALAALVRADWARDETELAPIRALVARRREAGSTVAIGFGAVAPSFSFGGGFGKLERALLDALAADPIDRGNAPDLTRLPSGSLRTLRVADVAAEARLAVQLVGDDANALVLVPDAASAARVRACAARNGVAIADDDPIALAQHGLVAALRPLVLLFASCGAAPLDHEDLLHLMRHPSLSTRGRESEQPDDEIGRIHGRQVHAAIAETCLVRAPVAKWRARFADIARTESASTPRLAETAEILAARLGLLAEQAAHGTLGALGAWVRAVGLSNPGGDAIARVILEALRAVAHVPATLSAFDEALARSASARRVDRGVRILRYREYDGRPASRLVLTGVHDKGLARTPRPHPFLSASDRRVLGVASGVDVMRERLALARWAVRNAGIAVAIAADTDASGRRVAFPIELVEEIAFDSSHRASCYGLGLELPELVDLSALGTDGTSDDPIADQIDAEWARDGSRFEDAFPTRNDRETWDSLAPPADASLDVQLARPLPVRRVSLPLLGHAGVYPGTESGLPPGFAMSASTLAHFTQCMFRGFAYSVLRVRPHDDAEEEATAPEIGTLVHEVLKRAMSGAKLVIPDRAFTRTRNALRDKLRGATDEVFREFAGARPHASPAVAHALEGQRQRWSSHWERWLDARLVPRSDAVQQLANRAVEEVSEWPEAIALLAKLDTLVTSAAASKRLRAALSAGLRDSVIRETRLTLPSAAFLGQLKKEATDVERVVRKERALVSSIETRFASEILTRLPAADGDHRIVLSEHDLGDSALTLGTESMPVRGRLDAVIEVLGSGPSSSFYKVVDWKTGKSGEAVEIHQTLTAPQLMFYALVLGEQLRNGLSLPRREVRELAYDRIKEKEIAVKIDEQVLARAVAALGSIVDRARGGEFPLAPHPKGCPLHRDGVYCDVSDACRYRGVTR